MYTIFFLSFERNIIFSEFIFDCVSIDNFTVTFSKDFMNFHAYTNNLVYFIFQV